MPETSYTEEFVPDYVEETDNIKIVTLFGRSLLQRLFVIVEMYDHKNGGRIKREYLRLFSESERKLLLRWYPKINSWYLKTGVPYGGVRMSIQTYQTLCKFANFFATV